MRVHGEIYTADGGWQDWHYTCASRQEEAIEELAAQYARQRSTGPCCATPEELADAAHAVLRRGGGRGCLAHGDRFVRSVG